MLPIAALMPVLIKNWKTVVAGLLVLAVVGTIVLAYKSHEHLIAETQRLAADRATLAAALEVERGTAAEALKALDEWAAREHRLAERDRLLAETGAAARRERRSLDERFAATDRTTADAADRDFARLFCLFARATSTDRRVCPGDPEA